MTQTYDFAWAIRELKSLRLVTRKGWNGKGMHLAIQLPGAGSEMTVPYIYLKTTERDQIPWCASQTDMLANDWEPVLT